MRKLLLGLALAAVALPAAAFELKAVRHSCYPTLEAWEKSQLRKVTGVLPSVGPFRGYVIRWDSGNVDEVTVGPSVDDAGNPAFCVIASRALSLAD